MNPINLVKKYITKALNLDEFVQRDTVGWHPIGGNSTYNYYKSNDYENAYSSIRVIANSFMMIEPYTLDKTGKKVESNILNRIYTPNTSMSSADFREALAVMSLVHPKVFLQVHYRSTRLTADTITGFTFLENSTEVFREGKTFYRKNNGQEITSDEVLCIKDINPYDLSAGYSPAQAAHRWTSLDDYIADYQKGFFRNGAVPAGQFVISARTAAEFNDIADGIEQKHRGSGNNNSVSFAHRPIDAMGKQQDSQIEWIPFSVQNKDMGLKEIFDQANQKIDSVYGVPASLRGVNDNNTYASVRIDEANFVKYHLNAFTLKIWTKFSHELNRVTGGTGLGISYKLEMPIIADEEKVKAEARSIDANTVTGLVAAGFDYKTAIAYIKHNEIDVLEMTTTELNTEDDEDVPIATNDELRQTPNQPNIHDPSTSKSVSKRASKDTVSEYENAVATVVKSQMAKQVDGAIAEVDGTSKAVEATDAEIAAYAAALLAALETLVKIEGTAQYSEGVAAIFNAGLDTNPTSDYVFSAEQKKAYQEYLKKVATSSTDTVAADIRAVLLRSREQGLSASQIKTQLKDYYAQEYRSTTLANTEVGKAQNRGSLTSMQQIQKETGYTIDKVWTHSGGDTPCQYCAAKIGTVVDVNENFVDLGGEIVGTEGGILTNNFAEMDACGAHPNDHCGLTYRIRG